MAPSSFPPDLPAYKKTLESWFTALQSNLIAAFETLEEEASTQNGNPSKTFVKTSWPYRSSSSDGTGGGTSALLTGGAVFEKAAVHFSSVEGIFPESFRDTIPGASPDGHFYATGVSLITHPQNPNVPTAHFNTRFIATSQWWFGGGGDLTPMLSARRTQEDPDSQAFHRAFQDIYPRHPAVDYHHHKVWCDEYFYLPHRNEPRGIGGVFYDQLNTGDFDKDFSFTQDIGRAFLSIYPDIVRRNVGLSYMSTQKEEQVIQRGRYVEFNLLYDRGTLFGLKTGGNVDTILSSLPPQVKWP